jgi:hypothetical protein
VLHALPISFLDFIAFIIFDEAYKLESSSFFSFLHPPATSCVIGPNVTLSTQFSDLFIVCSSHRVRHQCFTIIQNR